MNAVDHRRGGQKVRLAGAGSGAADVDASDRSIFVEDDGATGRVATVGVVSDPDSGDGCYADAVHLRSEGKAKGLPRSFGEDPHGFKL